MNWLIAFVLLLSTAVAGAEIAARVWASGKGLPASTFTKENYGKEAAANTFSWLVELKPHPYFGNISPTMEKMLWNLRSAPKGPEFVVAVTGGSVASMFVESFSNSLGEKLRAAIPALSNREIVVLNLAEGGFKQPQQFFVTSYWLDRLDLVINIDGISELGSFLGRSYLPVEYPFTWFKFFSGARGRLSYRVGGDSLLAIYYFLRSTVESWPWVAESRAVYLVWHRTLPAISRLERKHAESLVQDWREQAGSEEFANELEESAFIWKKYIRLSASMAKASGVKFFSFVPPNQYLNESKPMTAAERKLAIDEDKLRYMGPRMQKLWATANEAMAEKLPVHNLMHAFNLHSEVFYVDSCCHLNLAGNAILLDKIMQIIEKNWDN